MGLFKQCEGETAILVASGVYKQVGVFERDGFLFAAYSGGFVRLKYDGATSHPKVRLEHLDLEGPLYRTALGSLCRGEVDGAKPLIGQDRERLMIGAT